MISKIKEGFGDRLREERKRLGLTQTQFAEKAGVKRATQYLYEQETTSPNFKYFSAISDIGCDLSYLFFGTNTVPGALSLSPSILRDIFCIVDELCRDKKGRPLPLETRADFHLLLCSSYSGSNKEHIDIDNVKHILSR